MTNDAKIKFHSGANSVTGVFFALHVGGKIIAIDCGSLQGSEERELQNYDSFPINPRDIDALVITHAHGDHIGRVPKLVREGFSGTIYSTTPTRQLSQIMFYDALSIMQNDKDIREPLFLKEDIEKTMGQWKELPYRYENKLSARLSFSLHNSGHILGSAMVKFSYCGENILFTGDMGNNPDPLLPVAEKLDDIDYLIIESVYGGRNHPTRQERIIELERAIEHTIKNQGVLLIPTFALERAQSLLYIMNELVEQNRISRIPVFFDSPLAIKITDVFRNSVEYFNQSVKNRLVADPDVFDFPGLVETPTRDDSKSIFSEPNPKIIIASAGMSAAGRIVFHEKIYLSQEDTTILFIGYQAIGTVGRMIQDGVKKIELLGKEIDIRANIQTIQGFSAHADQNTLVDFVSGVDGRLKKVFCIGGDTENANILASVLRDKLAVNSSTVSDGEEFVL